MPAVGLRFNEWETAWKKGIQGKTTSKIKGLKQKRSFSCLRNRSKTKVAGV